jgi:hypothetical protein
MPAYRGPGEGDWQDLPGAATDIGIGANGHVWVVGDGGVPHYWEQLAGGASDWPVPPDSTLSGIARIAVASNGLPWAVGADQSIHCRTGDAFPGTAWISLPGLAFDIGIGGGQAWVVGTDGRPYYWNPGAPGGGNWALLTDAQPPSLTRIAVDPLGLPWAITATNDIFRRTGAALPGAAWAQVPGKASDIGVGADGTVWAIGLDGVPRYLNGAVWIALQTATPLSAIATGPDGQPWTIEANSAIQRWLQSDTQMSGVIGVTAGWWGGNDPAPLAVFVGELIFKCATPETLDMSAPPWFLTDWLAQSGCPNALGDMHGIADTPDGGMIGFFGSKYVLFKREAGAATQVVYDSMGDIAALIPTLDPAMMPFDCAYNDGTGITVVKGQAAVTLTPGPQGWTASGAVQAAFVGRIPGDWTSVDCVWLGTVTPGATGKYYAFHGSDFVAWDAGAPVAAAPPGDVGDLFVWMPNSRKRSLPGGGSVPQLIHQFETEHATAIRSAQQVVRDASQSFRSTVDELSYYHGPSADLQARLNAQIHSDSSAQQALRVANTGHYTCIYAGFTHAISLIGTGSWGTGLYVAADAQHSMAVAQAGGGGGLSIGLSYHFGMGYFLRQFPRLVGGNFVITGSLDLAGGLTFSIFFDSSGFAGFYAGMGPGLDFSGELGGAHTWNMGEWHA